MNQTASASAGTQSGTAPPIRTLTLWHALISAALCLITGVGLWWIYNKVLEQGQETLATRAETTKLQKRQTEIESTQVETRNDVRKTEADLSDRITSLKDQLTRAQKHHQLQSETVQALQKQVEDLESQRARGALQESDRHGQAAHGVAPDYDIPKDFEALKAEVNFFQDELFRLMDSEEGRRIAADEQHVAFVAGVVSRIRDLQERTFVVWADEINRALAEIPNGNASKRPEVAVARERFAQRFHQERAMLKDERLVLRQMHGEVSQDAVADSETTSVAKTLREAVAEHNGRRAAEIKQRTLAARQQAHEEGLKLLEEAEARNREAHFALKTQKVNADTAQVEAESRSLAEQQEAQRQERQARLAKEQLKRQMQAERSRIDNLLRPFTGHGFTQPGPLGYMRATADNGPVSLSRLRAEGALDNTIDGLTKLFCIGGGPTNEREKGGFPVAVRPRDLRDKPHILATVKEAQRLLNTYGSLLVEEQLLAD